MEIWYLLRMMGILWIGIDSNRAKAYFIDTKGA